MLDPLNSVLAGCDDSDEPILFAAIELSVNAAGDTVGALDITLLWVFFIRTVIDELSLISGPLISNGIAKRTKLNSSQNYIAIIY